MKVRKVYIILFVIAGIITNSCVDQLDVNIDREEFILVVQGHLTTQPGPHVVKLTRSAKYGSFIEGVIRNVTKATVYIRDQKGQVTILEELGFGEYVTPPNFRAEVGNSYILQIIAAGKTYYSTPELVRKAPEIDSLVLKYKKLPSTDELDFVSGIEVYSQWQDPGDESNFYMWKSSGIYTFLTHPEDHTVVDGFGNRIPAPLECCATCWKFDRNADRSVRVFSDINSNGNLITNLGAYITDDGERYMEKYYITLEQHSITKNAYQFLDLLNNQLGINGDIFDPPPATIRGNMISLDDPDEPVIGFFMVSDVSKKSAFLPRNLLEDAQLLKVINDDCRRYPNTTTVQPSFW